MGKSSRVFFVGMLITLSACCAFNAKHPAPKLSVAESLEWKTAALVRWVDDNEETVEADSPKATSLRPFCAAVWVNDDTMLTAEHCVESIGRPSSVFEPSFIQRLMGIVKVEHPVWNPTGQHVSYCVFGETDGKSCTPHDGIIVADDHPHELALIRAVTGKPIPKHLVADVARSVNVGEKAQIVGHPSGMWWSYTMGYVSQVRRNMPNADENPMDSIQVSAPVWYGNSGGGVFNADGELMGICSWIKLGNVPSMSFFVHRDEISRFLGHSGLPVRDQR